MCGRTACTLCAEDVRKACTYRNPDTGQYELPEWQELQDSQLLYKPSYNLAPTDVIPVIVAGDGEKRQLQPMIWGMIPPWHKGDPKKHGLTTHNCRVESMTTSKLYSSPLTRGNRCVVVCDGFYEWQTTKGKSNKQPYYIYVPQPEGIKIEEPSTWPCTWTEEEGWNGPELLKIAGLYEEWKSPHGELLYSCTTITMESNDTLSWMHHRMPAILDTDEKVADWLSTERLSGRNAVGLLKPVKLLTWHPVGTLVNNSRNKDEECNKPVTLIKPEVKQSGSRSLMESWLKRGGGIIQKTTQDSPDIKRVKIEFQEEGL